MKNPSILFLAFFSVLIFSCEKSNDIQSLESIQTAQHANTMTQDNPTASSRGRTFPNGKCFQRLISRDQLAIESNRQANNAAIKAHDAAGVASDYLEDFFILTSTNGLFTGKESVQGIYQFVFDSREDVIFVRTPTAITVNNEWNMASENGDWIGTWIVDGEEIEVGGDYYAKWHKIDGIWKLRSEIYTQFDCSGEVVCQNQPNLQ